MNILNIYYTTKINIFCLNRYYEDIQCMPPISEQDMNFVLREESTVG